MNKEVYNLFRKIADPEKKQFVHLASWNLQQKKRLKQDTKGSIKKAIEKAANDKEHPEKRIIQDTSVRPYFTNQDYFHPPPNELPKLDYAKLFSYLGSGVKDNYSADDNFEQVKKRIHAAETTIEKDEAYAIIKETAWAKTLGISNGHQELRNNGTFAYWKLFNGGLIITMYEMSFNGTI